MIQATHASDLDGLSSPVGGSSHAQRYTLSERRFAAVNSEQDNFPMRRPSSGAPSILWEAPSWLALLWGKLNSIIHTSLYSSTDTAVTIFVTSALWVLGYLCKVFNYEWQNGGGTNVISQLKFTLHKPRRGEENDNPPTIGRIIGFRHLRTFLNECSVAYTSPRFVSGTSSGAEA